MHIRKGKTAKQAHVAVPEGTFEEEHGRDGFYGSVSHLYHKNPPTNWINIEGNCRPFAIDTRKLNDRTEPIKFLFNNDVAMYSHRFKTADEFFSRNGDGDLIYFIHNGHGEFESDYGPLKYSKGDYIVIPRGTTYRFVPEKPTKALVIESYQGEIKQPDKGLLGLHALYDPASIEIPDPKAYPDKRKTYKVRIKRNHEFTTVTYGFHPLDVVGWKGNLSVWKINIKDFRPVMSHRGHLAPSVHTTMVGNNFVICSFVPRPLEEDKDAQRVPFWHRNIDYDEVIFYHDGDFFSRDGIEAEMVTFHPLGIHHGPHPKAYANQRKKDRTDEYAVMLDARNPLNLTEEAKSVLFEDYWKTWIH